MLEIVVSSSESVLGPLTLAIFVAQLDVNFDVLKLH